MMVYDLLIWLLDIRQVEELENAAVELLQTYEDCTHLSTAIKSVGDTYEPGAEVANFFLWGTVLPGEK